VLGRDTYPHFLENMGLVICPNLGYILIVRVGWEGIENVID